MHLRIPAGITHSRRAFTLVEVAIGFAVFAVLALGVTLSAMEYFKGTEEQSRAMAANSLAMSVLQQVSSYPYDQLLTATGNPEVVLLAYDSQGNTFSFQNDGSVVTASFVTITRSGSRVSEAENEVNLSMQAELVPGYSAIRVTIFYTYDSAYTGEEKQSSISTIRTVDEKSAEP
ncbi:MAG: type II secretion system protein [Verrucomicrobiota bacterium JB022]|nr:type II secretion system protein [Verrucomicrobiota bacterium JB022]